MLRISLRSLLAHKTRMVMAVLAVVLGVSFISGTLVFSAALQRIVDDAISGSATDLEVRPNPAIDGISDDLTLTDDDLDRVAGLDGVERAEGFVEGDGVYVLDGDDKVVGGDDESGTAISWIGMGVTKELTEGAEPQAADQVVLDEDTAEDAGAGVGDTVTLFLPDGKRRDVTVSGLFVPPGSDLAPARYTAMSTDAARDLLLEPGQWSWVEVDLADGASAEEVKDDVGAALGDTVEVRTAAEQEKDNKDATDAAVSIFTNVLLGFAIVSLLVGSFLIVNTFTMLVAQRSREMALLRAVGARRKQVTRALLAEAAIIGGVGGVVGMLLGLLVALGISRLLRVTGLELSFTPTLPVTAVVASLAVGVGVTVLAAYLPTRRAGRIAPVEALHDAVAVPDGPKRRRVVIGGVLLGLAVGAFVLQAASDEAGTKILFAGGGGLLLIIAAVALAPTLAALLLRLLPRSRSVIPRLARANTVRNPKRTAATASALMVGLALVVGVTVVASSITESLGAAVDDGDFVADLAVSASSISVQPGQLTKLDDATEGSIVTQSSRTVLIDDDETAATFWGGDPIAEAFAVDPVEGSAADVEAGSALVDEDTADDRDWAVGDKIKMTFANGETKPVTIAATYAETPLLTGLLVDQDDYVGPAAGGEVDVAFFGAADGQSVGDLKSALQDATSANPLLRVEDSDDVIDRFGSDINSLLGLIYGLLGLSVIIAILGVINTMAMSVMERTRELGMLRAVGLTRRMTRALIRRESIIIALIGAILGIAIGLVVGVALQRVLAADGIDTLAVPWLQIVVFLVLAVLIGVLAAVLPARRAAKTDILEAIATT